MSQNALTHSSNLNVLNFADLARVLSETVDSVRVAAAARGHAGFRMPLSQPSDSNLALAVQGESVELRRIIQSVLDQAITSVAPGSIGNVRVALKPGYDSIAITVEDNGRGFAEAFLHRTSPEEFDFWQTLRARVHQNGWRFLRQARLGVGSRVVVELPTLEAYSLSNIRRFSSDQESLRA